MSSSLQSDKNSAPQILVSESDLNQATVMVCKAPNQPMERQLLPIPARLETGEVLVRMSLATICGSDIHTFKGSRTEPMPTVLGHEGVGTIIVTGGGRPELSKGDRVTWSIADSCGQCPFCTEYELPQKCVDLFKYGHALLSDGSGLNGCYATHILLRRGTHIVKLPPEVNDRAAVSANCALATAVRTMELLPSSMQSILIQGAGLLGAFAVALLREQGVKNIYLVDRNQKRLSISADKGVKTIVARGNEPTSWDDVLQNHPFGVDAALEVAGARSAVPEAVRLLRPGGSYVLAGLVHPDSLLDITGEQLIRKCLSLHGTHNYGPVHLDAAINFLQRSGGNIAFDRIISPSIPLSDLNKAFALAQTGDWLRVAVDCGQI